MVEEGGRGLASRGTPLTGVERAGGKPSRAFSARPAAWPGGRHLSAREWMEEGTTATPEMERKRADATHARHRGRASDPAHLRAAAGCVCTRGDTAAASATATVKKTRKDGGGGRRQPGAAWRGAPPRPSPAAHAASFFPLGGRRGGAAPPAGGRAAHSRQRLPAPRAATGRRRTPLLPPRRSVRSARRTRRRPPRVALSVDAPARATVGRGFKEGVWRGGSS